jgi:hypothetical protein
VPAASVPLTAPRDGTPRPVETFDELADVVARMAAGSGPVAVDAERASGYRYTQRAYLVQLRRSGAGTVLIDPLPLDDLRFASAAEQEAAAIVALHGLNEAPAEALPDGAVRLSGVAQRYRTALVLDADQRIADGTCECNQFTQHRLRHGPCAHMLALRLVHARREVAA